MNLLSPLIFLLCFFTYVNVGCLAQITIVSNQLWKVELNPQAGWENTGFNDSAWPNATSPALNPCTPVIPGTQSMWWPSTTVTNVYFRYTFSLYGPVTNAPAQITADNEFFLYVNGNYVGTGNNWGFFYSFNLQPFFQCGENVIAIRGVEWVPGTCNLVTFTTTIDTSAVAAPIVGSNSPVCVGDDLSLSASAVPGANYNWSGPNGFSASSQNPVISSISALHNGLYQVFAEVNGCTSTINQVAVIVQNPATLVSIPKRESCFPGSDGFVDLFVISGTGPYSFLWSTSDTTEDIFNLSSGWYFVTVTDGNSCEATDSALVGKGYPAGPVDTAVWTGYINTDWFEPCNWDKVAVPDTSVHTLIPGNTPFQPHISGAVGNCKSLTIITDSAAHLFIEYQTGGKLIKYP